MAFLFMFFTIVCYFPLVIVKFLSFSQVVQRFQELFAQTKYKEAVELAAESPRGILRTPDTVAKFQVYVVLYMSVHLYMFFGKVNTFGLRRA